MEELNEALAAAECAMTPQERAEALENAIRNLATEAYQRGAVDLESIINFVVNATT